MPKVIVIGGGIIGASIAYRLTSAGAQVTLLEAGRLGGAASLTSFGWVHAQILDSHDYHAVRVGGMGEHYALREELVVAPWFHTGGNTEWNRGTDAIRTLRAKVTHLRSWGYQAEMLPVQELRLLEPDLAAPPDVEEFAYYPMEGWVDSVLLVGALVGRARAAGADVRTQCPVTGFIQHHERVTGVMTTHGERLYADVVVCCTGRLTGELVREAGIHLPMAPTVGMITISAPSAVRLRAVHHEDSHNLCFRPDGAGRIVMRTEAADKRVQEDTPTTPTPGVCEEILERVVMSLPGLAGTPIESTRIAVRPIPGDGYPVVGPAPSVEGLYLVCSHGGITLGPLYGRIVTREILTGEIDTRIRPFRPDRLIQQMAIV
jgi:glycine/D-amino acid oxidase-like deaminating enzyme